MSEAPWGLHSENIPRTLDREGRVKVEHALSLCGKVEGVTKSNGGPLCFQPLCAWKTKFPFERPRLSVFVLVGGRMN